MQTVMKVSKLDRNAGRIHFAPVAEKDGGAKAGDVWLMGVPAEQLADHEVGQVVMVTFDVKPVAEVKPEPAAIAKKK